MNNGGPIFLVFVNGFCYSSFILTLTINLKRIRES
jgi:hypothetical protein